MNEKLLRAPLRYWLFTEWGWGAQFLCGWRNLIVLAASRLEAHGRPAEELQPHRVDELLMGSGLQEWRFAPFLGGPAPYQRTLTLFPEGPLTMIISPTSFGPGPGREQKEPTACLKT